MEILELRQESERCCYRVNDGIIDVFPALPDSWKEGELSGVYAVGGHKLNLHWKDGAFGENVFIRRL